MIYNEQMNLSDFVTTNMEAFAEYATSHRFASYIDGLLLSQRRILWTMKDTDKFSKCATVAGAVMALHPHGDASIADAIFRLAQECSHSVPLIDHEGNVGRYFAKSHAAPRYVDMNLSKFARDVYFNQTHPDSLRYIPSETGDVLFEPLYLIPCIPMALLTGSFGIGIGFRCFVPILGLEEVCTAVMKYAEMIDNHKSPSKAYDKFAKYFIPDFPVHSRLLNYNELLQEYSKGNFDVPVITEGTMDISKDEIAIHTLPHDTEFEPLHMKLGEMIVGKDNFIANNFAKLDNLSVGKDIVGNVKLTLRRGVDPFTVLDELKKTIRFQGSWKSLMYFASPDNKLCKLDQMQILDLWYAERVRCIQTELKHTQRRLVTELRKKAALVAIVDHTDEILDLFKRSNSSDDVIHPLMQTYGLSEFQANYIVNDLKINQITKQGKESLLADKENISKKLIDLRDKFVHVPTIIYEDAEKIRKEYCKKYSRRLIIPEYKGAIMLPNGMIQCTSIDEINEKAKTFDDAEFIYMADTKYRYAVMNNAVVDLTDSKVDIPGESNITKIMLSHTPLKYTAMVDNDTLSVMEGLKLPTNNRVAYYIGKRCTTIDRNGKVNVVDTNTLPIRKGADATGIKSDIMYLSSTTSEEYLYIVYVNSSETNTIRISRIKHSGKLAVVPIGTTIYVGVFTKEDTIAFTTPKEIMNRCSIRHIYIPNIEEVMGGNDMIRVFLSKKNTSNNKQLVPYKKSVIWTVK